MGVVSLGLACAFSGEHRALAQTSGAEDRALAESLFQEGRDAMQKGDFAQACPKLAESYRIDAAVGTLLNLAVCHEQEGKLASAWAEFSEAATEAKRTGQKAREQLARSKAEALKPRVPTITLKIADALAQTNGAVVRIDGFALGRAAWATAVPVDPGRRTVRAEAPGKVPRAILVDVAVGSKLVVEVAPLEDAPAPASSAPAAVAPTAPPVLPASEAPPPSGALRTVGLVTGVVGVAALGAGAVFGAVALAAKNERDELCSEPANTCSSQAGVDADDRARTFATASTVAFVAGGALVATGLVVFFTAPKPMAAGGVRVAPTLGLHGGGLRLEGAF